MTAVDKYSEIKHCLTMKKIWNDYFRYNVPFFIFAGIAIALLVVAFILPPTAEIDRSVLEGASLIFAFSALWTVHTAVVKGIGAKLKHRDVEVEIAPEQEDQQ